MKYFTFKNGHEDMPEDIWLDLELYSESRLTARKTIWDVLYVQEKDEEVKVDDTKVKIVYVSERELEDGEEPDRIIRGVAPNGYKWQQSY